MRCIIWCFWNWGPHCHMGAISLLSQPGTEYRALFTKQTLLVCSWPQQLTFRSKGSFSNVAQKQYAVDVKPKVLHWGELLFPPCAEGGRGHLPSRALPADLHCLEQRQGTWSLPGPHPPGIACFTAKAAETTQKPAFLLPTLTCHWSCSAPGKRLVGFHQLGRAGLSNAC